MQRVYGVTSGVTIANVTPNGPAAKAGLLTGDTIVSVNGKERDDSATNWSRRSRPLSPAAPRPRLATFATASRRRRTSLSPIAQNCLPPAWVEMKKAGEEAPPQESKFGVTCATLLPTWPNSMNLPNSKGVLVQDVKPEASAITLA